MFRVRRTHVLMLIGIELYRSQVNSLAIVHFAHCLLVIRIPFVRFEVFPAQTAANQVEAWYLVVCVRALVIAKMNVSLVLIGYV